MNLPDQVRETIRQVIGLAPDHPIKDDFPLYSLAATPYHEVRICWILSARIGLNPIELIAEFLVGSNLDSHTVPSLVHSITEVLSNDSTEHSSTGTNEQASTASSTAAETAAGGWYGVSSAEDAAPR